MKSLSAQLAFNAQVLVRPAEGRSFVEDGGSGGNNSNNNNSGKQLTGKMATAKLAGGWRRLTVERRSLGGNF